MQKAYKPLTPSAADVQYPRLYKAMADVYVTTRDVLLAVRKKEDENIENLMLKQGKALRDFENIDLASFGSTRLTSRKIVRIKKNIEEQARFGGCIGEEVL